MILRPLPLVLLAGLVCATQARGQDKSHVPTALKQEMVDRWEELLRRIQTVRRQQTRDVFLSSGSHPLTLQSTTTSRYSYNPSGQLFGYDLAEYEATNRTYKENKYFISNMKYAAEITKSTNANSWLLTKVKRQKPDEQEKNKRTVTAIPWLQILGGSIFVPGWVQEPGFHITKVESRNGAESALKRLFFFYRPPQAGHSHAPAYVKQGFLDVDPRRYYCITRYDITIQAKTAEGQERGVLEYDDSGELPVLTSVTQESAGMQDNKGASINSKSVATHQIAYNGQVSDSEFTLPHYGLPEPSGMITAAPTPWYLWLVVAGAFCIVISIFLRRRWAQSVDRPTREEAAP